MILNKKFFSVGAWLQCSNSNSAEIISRNNFDWICLDFEHGAYDFSNIQDVIRSIKLNKKFCLVRSSSKNASEVSKLMDMGIDGVFVPKIETTSDVNKIYNAIYFSPKGERGVSYSRANEYGEKFLQYRKKSNKNIFIGMIESKKGVENLNKILMLKKLSGVFIGPYDLSSSLGISGMFEHKLFLVYLKNILKICKSFNIPCGIHVLESAPKKLEIVKSKGYSFAAYMTDSKILSNFYKI